MDIKAKAYQKYQLDWMLSHGKSLDDLMDCMQGWWEDDETREWCSPKTAFADFEKAGFDGELWACFDEFLESEYLDIPYMRRLLTAKEFEEYLQDQQEKASIAAFRDEFDFLSNFYPVKIRYNGVTFHNAEAAFQAQKDPARSKEFAILAPAEAKRLGRRVNLRSNWEDIKVVEMIGILQAKFQQNPEFLKKLLDTGDKVLIEGNTWHDNYWGSCHCAKCKNQGQNMLGRSLMQLREAFRKEIEGYAGN